MTERWEQGERNQLKALDPEERIRVANPDRLPGAHWWHGDWWTLPVKNLKKGFTFGFEGPSGGGMLVAASDPYYVDGYLTLDCDFISACDIIDGELQSYFENVTGRKWLGWKQETEGLDGIQEDGRGDTDREAILGEAGQRAAEGEGEPGV